MNAQKTSQINKHKSSASQGDHQIHQSLVGHPKSTHINIHNHFQNSSNIQNIQSSHMAQQSQQSGSNLGSQKSQRATHSNTLIVGSNMSHGNMASRASNVSSKLNQPGYSHGTQEQYKTAFSKNFQTRQSLGSQNTTHIGAYTASFPHSNSSQNGQHNAMMGSTAGSTTNSGNLQPKIISSQMRQSAVGHINNFNSHKNKENIAADVQMRCHSGGNVQISTNQQQKIAGHGRNYYAQQHSNQSINQNTLYQQQQPITNQNIAMGPSLNYSQTASQNFNLTNNASKFGHQQQIGPHMMNRTSPQASFLRAATGNPFPSKAQVSYQQQQQHYSSNKNVQCIVSGIGCGTPMQDVTMAANLHHGNVINSSIHSNINSSQSMKQAGASQALGSRMSHSNCSGTSINHGNKANGSIVNDISNKLTQKSIKQGTALMGAHHESSQCSAAQSGSGSNRIPQPSIINSATGNMNQILRQQSPKNDEPFKQVIESNYHSHQQQTQQNNNKNEKQPNQTVGTGISGANGQLRMREDELETVGHNNFSNNNIAQEGTRIAAHQNVQAPMIIEKKYNLHNVTSNPSLLESKEQNIQIMGQMPQRYGSRESTAAINANNMNVSMMHASKLSGNNKSFEPINTAASGQRPSSISNSTSMGQQSNIVKSRMRSNGTVGNSNMNSSSGQSRYHGGKIGQQQMSLTSAQIGKNGATTSTGMRQIEVSSRLQHGQFSNGVLGGVASNNSSFVMHNKYKNMHQKDHDSMRASGGLANSNINKSGQNLNNIHSRTTANKSHTSATGNMPHTQRSGRGISGGISNTINNTSGRSSLKNSHVNGIQNQQPSHQKSHVSAFSKQHMSAVSTQHRSDERSNVNKENRPVRLNKQSMISQAKQGSQLNQMSKRTTASEISRQSIVGMQTHQSKQRNSNQQQNSSLGMMQMSQQSNNKQLAGNNTVVSTGTAHLKSKGSTENENNSSSQGNASTSQRRNSSQHNTNRSNNGIQSSAASRTMHRLNDQQSTSGQLQNKVVQQQLLQQNIMHQHELSHHSNGSHSQQQYLGSSSQHQSNLLRRKSARELNNGSNIQAAVTNPQQDSGVVQMAQAIKNETNNTFDTEIAHESIQQVQGPTVLNGQSQQPHAHDNNNDENMLVDKDEDETTMGEAQVAIEADIQVQSRQQNSQENQVEPENQQQIQPLQPVVQSNIQQVAEQQVQQTNEIITSNIQSNQNPEQQVNNGPQTNQNQEVTASQTTQVTQQENLQLTQPRFDLKKLKGIVAEMESRRKEWLRQYKANLDLNDVLEIRNPQSVIEFVPEILVNMKKEEQRHMYPPNFVDRSMQMEITDKYRQYLVDWLAELHYKFKMWPETLFVTVGIIDKTLQKWKKFRKADLQCLGITALHIAGKYEEIYPPELKTILQVIDNAVTRQQVCEMEAQILQKLDFDLVWPSILRFMQRYACISNFSNEQHMIAQMFCDFILLNTALLQQKPSLLGAVAIYATNKITNRRYPWNTSLRKCTLGIQEEEVRHLANELFYFVKTLENSSLKTLFRKYELQSYNGVVSVLQKIQMPGQPQEHQEINHQNTKVESTQGQTIQSQIQSEDQPAPAPSQETQIDKNPQSQQY